MSQKKEKILVLGLGNLLMGDEGVGIHIIRQLQKQSLPDHIDVEDGVLMTGERSKSARQKKYLPQSVKSLS